jgi:hypothetical protein
MNEVRQTVKENGIKCVWLLLKHFRNASRNSSFPNLSYNFFSCVINVFDTGTHFDASLMFVGEARSLIRSSRPSQNILV